MSGNQRGPMPEQQRGPMPAQVKAPAKPKVKARDYTPKAPDTRPIKPVFMSLWQGLVWAFDAQSKRVLFANITEARDWADKQGCRIKVRHGHDSKLPAIVNPAPCKLPWTAGSQKPTPQRLDSKA